MKTSKNDPKLSLLTFSMIPQRIRRKMDARALCQLAVSNGISALDMMDIEVKLYGEKKLRAALEESGLRLDCLIANVNFYSAPQKAQKQIQAALQLAHRFEASTLMIVPGSAMDEKICTKMTKQQMLDIAVNGYQTAVNMAEPYGIRIGFENTPQWFKPLASAEVCLYVLEHVAGLGFIFDTGNVKVLGQQEDVLSFYEKIKKYLIRVHLKDVVVGDFARGERCADGRNMQAVMAGSGITDLSGILPRLHADGYEGCMAVEYAAGNTPAPQHSMVLGSYCEYIRACWNGTRLLPPYATIEGLDKPVSRLFFGTAIRPMLMGKNVHTLLDSVFARGITAFDCARGYGMAEKSLGNWVKDRNNRENVVLLTKCGNVNLQGKVHIDREVIEKELETSLKTLQTDYIDIFLLHRDDPKTPVSEIVDCLNDCKKQGKIRVFGVSNWTHQRIGEANAYAASHGLQGFTVSSPNYGLAEQVEDPWGGSCVTISGKGNAGARAWYAENQIPILAYSSLARGFFSGKFHSFDYDAAKKVLDYAGQKGYLHPVNMERLQRAEQLAREKGCSIAQIAMRYIFSNPMNVFALVSTQNPARMHENIEAARNPLTGEEAAWLENGNEQ